MDELISIQEEIQLKNEAIIKTLNKIIENQSKYIEASDTLIQLLKIENNRKLPPSVITMGSNFF